MKGVSFDRKSSKYRAYVNFGGTRIYLGFFSSEQEATTKRQDMLNRKSKGLIPCIKYFYPTFIPTPLWLLSLAIYSFFYPRSPLSSALAALREEIQLPLISQSSLASFGLSEQSVADSFLNKSLNNKTFRSWLLQNKSIRQLQRAQNRSNYSVFKEIELILLYYKKFFQISKK